MRRPKRPYTFTQLVTLSDGSTFVQRTTSPQPVYRSTKDVRNNPLWNPSSQKLLNIEEDEAGRLKRFRGRFGRGWDAEAVAGSEEVRLLCLLLRDVCLLTHTPGKRWRGSSRSRTSRRLSARPHLQLRQRSRGRRQGCWQEGGGQVKRQGQGWPKVTYPRHVCAFGHQCIVAGVSGSNYMYKKLGVGIDKGRYIDTLCVFYKYRGCLKTTGLGIFYHIKTFTITPPRSRWLRALQIREVGMATQYMLWSEQPVAPV